jgi:hypothetical protein
MDKLLGNNGQYDGILDLKDDWKVLSDIISKNPLAKCRINNINIKYRSSFNKFEHFNLPRGNIYEV